MVSWRNKTLQFLCLFLCSIHLTKAHCDEYFTSVNAFIPNFSLENLTEIIPLVNASNLKDMMICTLLEMNKKRKVDHVLRDCMDIDPNNIKNASNCGNELPQSVTFSDLVCLVAKAIDKTTDACSHEVVVDLYLRFDMIPTATTLPTEEQPETIAKLNMTSPTSPSTVTASPPSPPTVTASPPSPSTVTASPPSPSTTIAGTHWNQKYNNQAKNVIQDSVMYSMLALSLIVNLLLVFFVAMRCQTRSNHGPFHPGTGLTEMSLCLQSEDPQV